MGSYRSQPDRNKITNSKTHQGIEYAVCHMCGWRLYMEDTTIQLFDFDRRNNHLFGIFDGHGGGEVSIFVKRHFGQQLLKNKNYLKKRYQQALEETFEKMDELLKQTEGKAQIKQIQTELILEDNLPKRDSKKHAGCTALVCLLAERTLYVSNAGDSHAYAKKDGQFISLNYEHKPQDQEQYQRIQNAGGIITEEGRINGCLNVSRGIGDMDFKCNKKLPSQKQIVISLPDTQKQSQQGVQYILMGCDGIWEQKQPHQIQDFIDQKLKQKLPLHHILELMFDEIICKEQDAELTQFGKDNMSAILIKL